MNTCNDRTGRFYRTVKHALNPATGIREMKGYSRRVLLFAGGLDQSSPRCTLFMGGVESGPAGSISDIVS
jgi:hypothetical protein